MDFIFKFHYSKVMPKLTKHILGFYHDDKLIGVITLGWGVQPLKTINKLFPSLTSKDYLEIGKMCFDDKMGKNTESQSLSKMFEWVKNNTNVKLIFTWADGCLGKCGYVYQSANMLYGEYIFTDFYLTNSGEKVHPRTSQGLADKGDKKCGHRPTKEYMIKNGWGHYKGKQFRYIYFTCDKKTKKKLLKESTITWNINYPKQNDLQWQKQDLDTGKWEIVKEIGYNKNVTTIANKTAINNKNKVVTYNKAKEFFDL